MKLIEKWYSIELNIEFWINQDTSAIPQKYLKEIGIFRNPKFIFSEVSDFTKPLNEYLQLISQYNNLKVLLPVFSKVHFDAIIHKLNNNCNIELIINETIFKSIISHGYRKKLFDNLDNNEKRSNLKIWKVEEDLNIFLTVSEDFRFCESWDPSEDLEDSNCFTTSESLDNYEDLSTSENLSESKDFCNSNDLSESEDFMTLSLFFEDGSYNDSCILVDTSENAINWGLNLFNHYKKIAIPLKLFFNERYQSKYE